MNDLAWNLFADAATVGAAPDAPTVGGVANAPMVGSTTREGSGDEPVIESDPHAFPRPATPSRRHRVRFRNGPLAAFTLLIFGFAFDRALRFGPLGLGFAFCGIAATLIARCAVSPVEDVRALTLGRGSLRWRPMLRNVAVAVNVAACVGSLWRASSLLRFLDFVIVVGGIVIAADVRGSAGGLVMRRLLVLALKPVEGFVVATGRAIEGSWKPLTRRVRRSVVTKRLNGKGALRLVTGATFAVPVVAVFAVLLHSADPVFGSLFQLPSYTAPNLSGVFSLVASTVFFALVLAAPIVSGAMMSEPLKVSNIRSARTEALVVLHSLNALFAVFCLTQVVAAIGGARRVLTTDGLTYAEYARSGFFQLLTVSVLALGVIGVCRFAAGDAALLDRRFRWPLLATSLLTLAITGVAVRRLALYIDAFGVTEQRIVAMAGSLVVGATFVLVGWSITRGRVGIDVRGWSTAGALGCAVGAIALLHLIGPSRWAVNDGLRRVERGSDFRTNVAAGLGNFERTGFAAVVAEADTDSVATLFAWVNQKPQERVEHRRSICAEFRGLQSSRPRGWWQWHASDATARQLLTQNCPKAVG